MEKYLLLYYGRKMETDPALSQNSMASWNTWFADMGKTVVDGDALLCQADWSRATRILQADILCVAVGLIRIAHNSYWRTVSSLPTGLDGHNSQKCVLLRTSLLFVFFNNHWQGFCAA